MKTLKAALVLALPIILVVSCATPAYVEKDETADFSRYKTFAWIESDKTEVKNRHHEFMKKHVQEAATAKLQKKDGVKTGTNRMC